MAVSPTSASNPDGTTPERMLLDHVRRVERALQGRYAVHLRLSQLRDQYRQPHHIRIAARSFDAIVNSSDARLYVLGNADMVLMCRDVRIADVDSAIYKVRALFRGDPLVLGQAGEAGVSDDLAVWYDLEGGDYQPFAELVQQLASLAGIVQGPSGTVREDTSHIKKKQRATHSRPLDPKSLDAVCLETQRANIADLIQQQPAVWVGVGGQGSILFREYFVAIGELQKRIAPDFNLTSNPWLFQHLTELLDRRVLAVVGHTTDFERLDAPVSLNLNISTVLGREFGAFTRRLGPLTDRLVVEFQKVDVFADIDAYATARDLLHEQDTKVLIDGLTPISLQFFDPSLLEADYYKIYSAGSSGSHLPPREVEELRTLVMEIGRERVILARASSEDDVEFGLQIGIHRFQGHLVDRLIAAMSAKLAARRRAGGEG